MVDGSSASSFDNCTIEDATYGITFGGSSSVYHQVDHCNIEGRNAAVWMKSYSDPTINNSYLKASGYQNVVLSTDNSDGKIRDCEIKAENYQVINGHKNMNSASPCFGDIYGLNIIDGTKFTTAGSSIYVSGGYPYFNYGYNSILSDQYLYQYSNYSGSTRYAYNNYWGGGAPVVQGNTVIYSGYLSNPNPNAGPNWALSKSSGLEEELNEKDEIAAAWEMYYDKEFSKTKETAKELFKEKSKEDRSCEILFLWMKSALREGTLKEEENYLEVISKDYSLNELARYESLRWLSKLAVGKGEFEKAEKFVLSIPSTSLMGKEILFDVASEIMDKWGDLEKATAVLNKLTVKYRDNKTLTEKDFVLTLYTENLDKYSGSGKNETPLARIEDNSTNLSEAYPNPFNPTTTITYSIPDDGKVVLRVFDVLGREVKTLLNEEKQAGTHKVNFNGNDLSSGIYFYTLQTNSKVVTKKMLLVK